MGGAALGARLPLKRVACEVGGMESITQEDAIMAKFSHRDPFHISPEVARKVLDAIDGTPPDLSHYATPVEAAKHAWEWAYQYQGVEIGYETTQDDLGLAFGIVFSLTDRHLRSMGIDLGEFHVDAMYDGLKMFADEVVKSDPQRLPRLRHLLEASGERWDRADPVPPTAD